MTSGGTCLKSSRRLSTKIEGERRKRKKKEWEVEKLRERFGEVEENKEENKTKYKQNRSKFHHFLIIIFFINNFQFLKLINLIF